MLTDPELNTVKNLISQLLDKLEGSQLTVKEASQQAKMIKKIMQLVDEGKVDQATLLLQEYSENG